MLSVRMPPDRVFRITFRSRGKEYRLISLGPGAREAGEAVTALSSRLEVLGVEDLGLRSEMDDAEFERLRKEHVEQS